MIIIILILIIMMIMMIIEIMIAIRIAMMMIVMFIISNMMHLYYESGAVAAVAVDRSSTSSYMNRTRRSYR